MRKILGFLAILIGVTAVPAGAEEILRGTWESRLPMFGDSIRFDLEIESGDAITLRQPADAFDGLTRTRLKTTGETLRFGWTRAAGTLRFEGQGRWFGRPSGTLSLETEPEFVEQLEQLGIARPTPRQLLDLLIRDVPGNTVAALSDAGYTNLEIRDLTQLDSHGVRSELITEMQRLDDRPTVNEMVRLRIHGIGASTFRQLDELSLGSLAVEDLIAYRINGIGPSYLRGMVDAGIPLHDRETIVRLRRHGISPDYVVGLTDGTTSLTMEDVVDLRINGIDTSTYRELAELGYAAADQVITLQRHGIDPAYVRRLSDGGNDGLSVEQLIDARRRGL